MHLTDALVSPTPSSSPPSSGEEEEKEASSILIFPPIVLLQKVAVLHPRLFSKLSSLIPISFSPSPY